MALYFSRASYRVVNRLSSNNTGTSLFSGNKHKRSDSSKRLSLKAESLNRPWKLFDVASRNKCAHAA